MATFYLRLDGSYVDGSTPTIDWSYPSSADPTAPEPDAPDNNEYDHPVSGTDWYEAIYSLNTVSQSGSWFFNAADGAPLSSYGDSSDWDPPYKESGSHFADLNTVDNVSISGVIYLIVTSVGSGTANLYEIVYPNLPYDFDNVLAGTQTLSFGPDSRLASDTQFTLHLEVTHLEWDKVTHTNNRFDIIPLVASERFDWTPANDGDGPYDPYGPVYPPFYLGETVLDGVDGFENTITFTVSNNGSEGPVGKFKLMAQINGPVAATSASLTRNSTVAGGPGNYWPNVVQGTADYVYFYGIDMMDFTSISVNISILTS